MSDGPFFHVRTAEEVLSDDHAGVSDNAGCTRGILGHICESVWTPRYSSLLVRPQ